MIPDACLPPEHIQPIEAEPQPTIADLLAKSRAAHLQYRQGAHDPKLTGRYRDYPTLEAHVRQALELREQAHTLDPEHTDPAWTLDQVTNKGRTHQQLVDSYRWYLSTP